MRFQDAAPDARAVVYAGIQADPSIARIAELLADANTSQLLLARAILNGESNDPATWRAMVPTCFPDERSEAILAASLEIAAHADRARNQYRGAIVESLTETLLVRRVTARGGPRTAIRRERRILFDGVRAEIHPYDVTVELPAAGEAYDCKWSARGIDGDVLHQLDDARTHAVAEDERLRVALVVFDTRLACGVRLARRTEPYAGTGLVTIEGFARLGGART